MPIFDYVCKDCNAEFDLLVGKNAQEEEKKCIKCGSTNISRKFSSFGLNINHGKDLNSCPTCTTGTCGLD